MKNQDALDNLLAEISDLKTVLRVQGDKIATFTFMGASEEVGKLQAHIDRLGADANVARNGLAGANALIVALQDQLMTRIGEHAELKAVIGKQQTEIYNLRASSARADIDSNRALTAKIEEMRKDFHAGNGTRAREIEALKATSAIHTDQIEDLQARLRVANDKIAGLQFIGDSGAAITELKKEFVEALNARARELNALNSAIIDLRNQSVVNKGNSWPAVKAEVVALDATTKKHVDLIGAIEQENVIRDEQFDGLQAIVQALGAEKDAQDLKLRDLRSEVERMQLARVAAGSFSALKDKVDDLCKQADIGSEARDLRFRGIQAQIRATREDVAAIMTKLAASSPAEALDLATRINTLQDQFCNLRTSVEQEINELRARSLRVDPTRIDDLKMDQKNDRQQLDAISANIKTQQRSLDELRKSDGYLAREIDRMRDGMRELKGEINLLKRGGITANPLMIALPPEASKAIAKVEGKKLVAALRARVMLDSTTNAYLDRLDTLLEKL